MKIVSIDNDSSCTGDERGGAAQFPSWHIIVGAILMEFVVLPPATHFLMVKIESSSQCAGSVASEAGVVVEASGGGDSSSSSSK